MTNVHAKRTTMAITRVSIALLVLAALAALTAPVVLAAPASQGPVAGEQAWAESGCKNCHGEMGEGLWAGPLAGHEKTAEEWIAQVRTPRRNMPSFSVEQISDETITDIHAYLTSLSKPEGEFAPADAGLPDNAPEGQQLIVAKRCVACHSERGPVNGFISRGETPTVEGVIAQLRTPRRNMPSFSVEQVSEEEAVAITDFLVVQIQPASLPTSGGEPIPSPVMWVLVGVGLLWLGLLWRRSVRNV
jgi:mono/diheme cytochrome c family protein